MYIIITIFALYVFLDGILRIYPLLIMVFAFLIGKSTLGRGANSILSFCLTKFYKFISFRIYLIALPIYHIFIFFIKVLIKRFAPCLLKIKRRKSKIKVRKKIKYAKREIKELLTK